MSWARWKNGFSGLLSSVWRKRRALLGAFVLAGAILALSLRSIVVGIVPGFIDGLLSREIGYHLLIEDLDFEVGSMRLVAHDLVLAPIDGGPPVGTCSRAVATIDLTRILRGVYIEDLELDAVAIRAQRRANGSLDVIDTIVAARAKHPPPMRPLHIERLRSRSVTVVVTDAESAVSSSSAPLTHTLVLDVLGQRIGTLREGPPLVGRGDFTVMGSGGDLAARVSIVGQLDLTGTEHSIRAKVALKGADLNALASSAACATGSNERVDLQGEAGVVLRDAPGYDVDLEVQFANLSLDAGRERPVSVRSASARLYLTPGRDAVWREVAIDEPRIAFERLDDGSLTVAGLQVLEPPRRDDVAPAPPRGTSAGILDRLEAALVSSGTSTTVPGVTARGASRYPLPVIPEAVGIENGELRLGEGAGPTRTELTVRALTVVERVQRERGSARLLARVDAVSPSVADHLRLELDGALTDHALAGSAQLSVAGVTTSALTRLMGSHAEDFLAGELGARATFELERENRTRFSGKLDIRDARFRENGAVLARLDALAGEFSLELGRERPSLHVPRLAVEGAWAKVTRSSSGGVLLAGIALRPTHESATEPAIDLVCDRVELRRMGVRLDPLESDVTFDGTLAHVALGEAPGLASFAIHGSANGLVEDLAASGRAFTSRVSPAAIVDVRATGLRSSPVHLSQSLALALDGGTLAGRFGWALAGQDMIARVSSVVVADCRGPELSLETGRAHVTFSGCPGGVVVVDGVELVRPLLTLEPRPGGLAVARALTWTASDSPESGPAIAVVERPKAGTLRLHGLRIEDGEVDVRRGADPFDLVRVRRIEALALRKAAEGRAEEPLELDLAAEIAGLASGVHVTASFDGGALSPRLRAEIDARGLELAEVSALWSGIFSGSPIHAGKFHAGVEVSVRQRQDVSLAGELLVRDLVLEDDDGDPVFGLAQGCARDATYQRSTGELYVGALDLERSHMVMVRESSGELVFGGFNSGAKVLALSEGASRRAAPPPPRSRSHTAAPSEGIRIEIDHLSVGGGSFVFVDHAAHDAQGRPPVLSVTDADGSASRLVFGRSGFEALNDFFSELSLGDGARFVAGGSLVHARPGMDGALTLALRDFDVARVAPYRDLTQAMKLAHGRLTLEVALTLTEGRALGDATVISRDATVISRSAKPELDGVASLDVPFEGELSDLRVRKGLFVGRLLGSALLDAVEQPLKLLRPIDAATGTSVGAWILRKVRGPGAPLSGPVTALSVFAPGDSRLSAEAADALATVAPYAAGTDRVVSLRAVSGASDRALATRAGRLAPEAARDLWLRFGARRAALESDRRERALAEHAALVRGDAAAARAIRAEVVDLAEAVSKLDLSLDELGNRIAANGPASERGERDDALRALARERVEAIREALVRAGVDRRQVRVRLALLQGDSEQESSSDGNGLVEIEVHP